MNTVVYFHMSMACDLLCIIRGVTDLLNGAGLQRVSYAQLQCWQWVCHSKRHSAKFFKLYCSASLSNALSRIVVQSVETRKSSHVDRTSSARIRSYCIVEVQSHLSRSCYSRGVTLTHSSGFFQNTYVLFAAIQSIVASTRAKLYFQNILHNRTRSSS